MTFDITIVKDELMDVARDLDFSNVIRPTNNSEVQVLQNSSSQTRGDSKLPAQEEMRRYRHLRVSFFIAVKWLTASQQLLSADGSAWTTTRPRPW